MSFPNVRVRWWWRGRRVRGWGRWFSAFHGDVVVVELVVVVYERRLGLRVKGFAKVPLITVRVIETLCVTIEEPFMAPSPLIYPFSHLLLFPPLIFNPFKYSGEASFY